MEWAKIAPVALVSDTGDLTACNVTPAVTADSNRTMAMILVDTRRFLRNDMVVALWTSEFFDGSNDRGRMF